MWMDVGTLKLLALLFLVVVVLSNVLVLRMVQRMAVRVVMFLILLTLAVSVWIYRDNLDECRRTCSCSVFGLDVQFSPAAERVCDFNSESEL